MTGAAGRREVIIGGFTPSASVSHRHYSSHVTIDLSPLGGPGLISVGYLWAGGRVSACPPPG